MIPKKVSFQEFSTYYTQVKGFFWEDAQTYPQSSLVTLFSSPYKEFQIFNNASPKDLRHQWETVWKETEKLTEEGLFLAGFLTYELGYLSSESLYSRLSESDRPLLSLTAYHRKETFLVSDPVENEILPSALVEKNPQLSAEEFEKTFSKIQTELLDGNTYQLNFTFPWDIRLFGNPFHYYQSLKLKQRTKYSAFFSFLNGTGKEVFVLSLSPELFWKRSGQHILVQPMKGTSPRGMSPDQDEAIKKSLVQSEKERAENLMIVDLLRNDLGRVAKPGSVRVKSLFDAEPLESVWQMTSQIEAELIEKSFFNSLISLFPSGSVTGAPKINSMKILSRLESTNREIYTGAILQMETLEGKPYSIANVPIRTLVLEEKEKNHLKGRYFTGSGITVLSQSDLEYAECLQKASFLEEALPKDFCLLETMAFYPSGIRFWKEHKARLQHSAKTLGFPYSEAKLNASYLDHSRHWTSPKILRLLLSKSGGFIWEAKPLENPKTRVIRKVKKIQVGDMLTGNQFRHKTDQRKIYSTILDYAKLNGWDDVLLCNENDQVVETCLKNVFYKEGGNWFTPSLKNEGLKGVLRERLIQKGWVTERDLHFQDLMKMDKVLIGNSVRGFEYVVWEIE